MLDIKRAAEIYATDQRFVYGRVVARAEHLSRFYVECPTHGLALFSVASGECDSCDPKRRRVIAREYGESTYDDVCLSCGPTRFGTLHGKCVNCFTLGGAPRRRVPGEQGARAVARAAGVARYMGVCSIHGETAYGARYGRCLTCFTIDGVPRTRERGDGGPRALARRAGEARYMGVCSTHGETAHSVAHGRCLTCFTAGGAKRVFAPRVRL